MASEAGLPFIHEDFGIYTGTMQHMYASIHTPSNTHGRTHRHTMCCFALKASAVDKTATVDPAPQFDLYSSLHTPLEMSADVHS